jgi:hypothetical protein
MINYISCTSSVLQIEVDSSYHRVKENAFDSASSDNDFVRCCSGKWQVYFVDNIYARLLFMVNT